MREFESSPELDEAEHFNVPIESWMILKGIPPFWACYHINDEYSYFYG